MTSPVSQILFMTASHIGWSLRVAVGVDGWFFTFQASPFFPPRFQNRSAENGLFSWPLYLVLHSFFFLMTSAYWDLFGLC